MALAMANYYIFMTALFAALLMIPYLQRWALERGEVDVPDACKVHTAVIPRLGGIAVFTSFLFSLLVFAEMTQAQRGILAGGLVVFVTGLVDDLGGLTPWRKFLGEIGGCLLAVVVGRLYLTHLGDLFGFGPVILPLWLAIPFTVFAVVGVINAVNLIDGLDGLAGGVSVIALTAFLTLAWADGNAGVIALCAGLLGSLLGFLKYNFYPTRIFMGDAGSLTVGYVLGFLAVLLTQGQKANISPMAPVLILGAPILDTLWVMVRRSLRGGSPFAPDRTHVHHKFLDLGFQHRFTVIIIYGISLFWAVFAVVFRYLPAWQLLVCFLLTCVAAYLGLRYVLRHPESFAWLRRDSSRGLRESLGYQRLAGLAARLVPCLTILIFVYLGIGFLAGVLQGDGGSPWQLTALLLAGVVSVLLITRSVTNPFLLAMLYFVGLAVTLEVESLTSQPLVAGFSLRQLTDALLLLIALLAGLKVMLRQAGEFFFASIDFLLLGLSLFLAVTLRSLDAPEFFAGAFIKGIALFLGVKVVNVSSHRQARAIVLGLLVVLAGIIVGGVG